jgi:hypothetical protein
MNRCNCTYIKYNVLVQKLQDETFKKTSSTTLCLGKKSPSFLLLKTKTLALSKDVNFYLCVLLSGCFVPLAWYGCLVILSHGVQGLRD